jgi:putative pyruvate formate lyase activating enzyme
MDEILPGYISLLKTGELAERIEKLNELLRPCMVCPRQCSVDREVDNTGFCGVGRTIMVSGMHPHYGEESPLVGRSGSGTIFLTGCNLRCIYCQNCEISHLCVGEEITKDELVKNMLRLQNMGCHNINFVTPTHYTPQLVEAIAKAANKGLKVPIVYNCGGYEKLETIRLLDGIIDIYMPDMKYGRSSDAEKYSKAKNYPEICFKAISEMHRQVGDLKLDSNNIAYRGLLVRHLVLPGDIAGSEKIFRFLADKVSKSTYINIMDQYRPEFKAWKFKELSRKPTSKEYQAAVDLAESFGLTSGETFRHKSLLERIRDEWK